MYAACWIFVCFNQYAFNFLLNLKFLLQAEEDKKDFVTATSGEHKFTAGSKLKLGTLSSILSKWSSEHVKSVLSLFSLDKCLWLHTQASGYRLSAQVSGPLSMSKVLCHYFSVKFKEITTKYF